MEEITQTITQTKDEGWRLFLFFPYWHGFILVNVTKKNQDLPIQIVRTPDMAELEIPVSLTWTPLAAHLVEYLNAGGENGVKTILEDIVRERLREWAIVGDEGPQNWEEAMKARVEAASILTKAIVGEELSPIPSDIPTTILLKFFDKPQKFPTPSEMEKFGIKLEEAKEKFTDFDALPEEQMDEILNWGRVKEKIDELSSEEKENLEKALKQRKAIINSIRQGNGMQEIPQLGIVLNRLNIGEMKPRGKLAEAAELKAEEIKKMEGDKIRIENVTKRIVELEKLGFSPEQALEILQTERGKVKKEIKESKLNISPETRTMIEKMLNISPETRTMIEKITLDLLPNLLKRGGNQNG